MGLRKKMIVALSVVSVVALVVLFSFLLYLLGTSPNSISVDDGDRLLEVDDTRSGPSSDYDIEAAPDDEGDDTASPLLDLPGIIPATGQFDMGSMPDNVDFDLDDSADEYTPIIAAIQSVDPNFDPKGYMIRAHAGHHDSNGVADSVNVTVTFYIEDIETSSSVYMKVKDGDIQYVNMAGMYHPLSTEIEQAIQQKADFENSAAGREAIEHTKAAMWPADSTATPDEYSEEYYFDFNEGRLYLTITDDRRIGDVIDARQERIDCLEVLGR
jgi:hypothetical protein